jgi:hypothetical protein
MSAKEIVFRHITETKGKVNLQDLTKEILKYDPSSKWDNSHWSFYRTQITSKVGRYTDLFNDEIKRNLRQFKGKVDRGSFPTSRHTIHKEKSNVRSDKWLQWEVPNENEELMLARVLLPYIKILHPHIIASVVEDNNKNLTVWSEQLQNLGVNPTIYLWHNSPVAFPGIRRHVGTGETSSFRSNPKLSIGENALYLDDNSYPKEVWSFALRNLQFGKKNPPEYSLAHILDHKDHNSRNTTELTGFQLSEDKHLYAGLYTSCVNSFYVPTNFLKPTDHNSKIRQLLIQIVDKYYGAVCNPLPFGNSFNLNSIEGQWRLENFPEPVIVGNLSYINNFLAYRNRVINKRIGELAKTTIT